MMNDTRLFDRRAFVRAALTLILALCLCLSVLPAAPVLADPQSDALNKLVSWGVMSGYPDGSLHPERALTRAEFVALVNRAYGYKETGSVPFQDVPYTAWYSDDISIAYNAGYFSGTSTTTASPNDNLTREQAMTLLARSMRLDSIPGEVTEFSDGRSFSTWSRGYVKAAYQKGLIGGYDDGSFRPLRNITRGEMAILLSRALGTLIHEQGEHTLGSVYGNVTINTPNATLYDTTIVGDLYITGGLGLGSVVLDNVRVLGSIIVAGGGESEAGEDSVVLRNVRADELKIDSLAKQYLSLRTEGETIVTQTLVRSDAFIQDRTQAGQGLLGITLEGANGKYTLTGNLENVVNKAAGSTLKISRGTLDCLTIDETAVGSKLEIYNDATVKELNLDTAVNVTGSGDIGSLNVNTAGSSTTMLPDKINIRPGITANIYNETMDTELGNEASSDPRILAGYPKAGDVAPTTMTATVATNKSGTLYWAVSAITDGSVGEEGLLSPAAYGSKAVKYGTLQVGKSNTEININVTGLTIGGNYYFSAMLVDARNDRSPVKVVSFSTPDNTVPNYASGYPALTENSYDKESTAAKKYYAEFTVKSTKTCNLYWVVYTKGSTAPTAAEFRSGSLDGSVAHNRGDRIQRNDDFPVRVDHLEELTDYDIYFWLNDLDNTKSSAVKKLTFKTTDGTPPVFVAPPAAGQPAATSLKLTTTVNENATVYWVAVTADADYPQGRPTTVAMDDLKYAIFQVENGVLGSKGVKSGKTSVKADTEATINISGLKAETAYDIWFVAKDAYGNYSAFNTRYTTDWPKGVAKDNSIPPSYVRVNTLDTSIPFVEDPLTFSRTDSSGRPYPNATISLIFSEDVQRYSYIGNKDGKDYSLLSAKDDPAKIRDFLLDLTKSEDERVLVLHHYSADGKDEIYDDWFKKDKDGNLILDGNRKPIFRDDIELSVKLDNDGKRVVLDIKGLELNSGSYYYFEFNDLADTSNAQNRMPDGTKTEQFRTVSSKVVLDEIKNLTQIDPKAEGVNGVTTVNESYKELIPKNAFDVHKAFKFTPDATSTDNGTRDWDIIIRSDTTAEFQLYRRFVPAAGKTLKNYWDENENYKWIKTDQWELLPGDVSSTTASKRAGSVSYRLNNAIDRLGKTLFGNFDFAQNASGSTVYTNHLLKDLPDDGAYFEFAIRFTKIGSSTTADKPETWDQDVTLTINVVAGDGVLSSITRLSEISESHYDKTVDVANSGVEDISEPLSRNRPFTLNPSFTDTSAPSFYNGFPMFYRDSDTSITMTVTLNRAGTLFWVATPVGSTAEATKDINLKLAGTDEDDTPAGEVKFRGGNTDHPEYDYDSDDHLDNIKTAVESQDFSIDPKEAGGKPLNSLGTEAITEPDNKQPRIKSGSAPISGTGGDTIPITDLEPGTGYFIYVVLKGAGSTYSDHVMLYCVATRPSDRPVIVLGANNDGEVTVNTNNRNNEPMASKGKYLVMQYEEAALRMEAITGTTDGLYTTLEKCVSKSDLSELEDNNISKDMTLLQALDGVVNDPNTQNPIGSIFDVYVKQEIKNSVRQYIQNNTSNTSGAILGGGDIVLPTSGKTPNTITVNLAKDHKASLGSQYVFLATATNSLDTERGFSAYFPVVIRDNTKPSISSIGADLYYDDTAKTLSGTLTVNFDRPVSYNLRTTGADDYRRIYNGDENFEPETENDTTGRGTVTVGDEEIKVIKAEKIMGTYQPSGTTDDGKTPYYSIINEGFIDSAITFELKGIKSTSPRIPFNLYLCNELGTFDPSIPCVVYISYRTAPAEEGGGRYADVYASDWTKPDGTRMASVLLDAPFATSAASANLAPNETYALTALQGLTPVSAIWSSDNTRVATVDSRTGIVLGKSEGTAKITATATINGKEMTASCLVTVTAPGPIIELSASSLGLTKGGKQTLTATLNPWSNDQITWSSSNPKIAEVGTKTGVVTGVSEGKTTIIATATVNGKKVTAKCPVEVYAPSFIPNPESKTIRRTDAGFTLTLECIGVEKELIKSVEWHCTNTNLVTYSTINTPDMFTIYNVRANSQSTGSADIYATVTTTDGKTYPSSHCKVTVTN